MLQVEHKGILVTRVGKTSYTYDKQGPIIESVTRQLSRKALVKKFTYHGSSGQLATFSSSDAGVVRKLWTTPPGILQSY